MILFANKIIPLNSRVHSLNYNLHIMSICLENTCIQLYVIVFFFLLPLNGINSVDTVNIQRLHSKHEREPR